MSYRKDANGSNSELAEKAQRRRFDATNKLRTLQEADPCIESGRGREVEGLVRGVKPQSPCPILGIFALFSVHSHPRNVEAMLSEHERILSQDHEILI